MHFLRTEQGVKDHLAKIKEKKIGFVPTMGALHEGHRSLIEMAANQDNYTVVSIFVNPTQFNDPADLEKYPRTLAADIEFLKNSHCDLLFCPDENEIYKTGEAPVPEINLGHLDRTLEAEFRPGHFKGVMQVVARLLKIVKPHDLYMGQKDLQQFVVLRTMIEQLHISTNIIPCPIIREENGLAKSSRNRRIGEAFLRNSDILYRSLVHCRDYFQKSEIDYLRSYVQSVFRSSDFQLEYFEFLDADTFEVINRKGKVNNIIAVIAAWAGDVRLIDNMIMSGELSSH
ncbi:pantoate--beta-alanine ligase [Membranihabitans maritimus]|uniref:pantoate--beta-alanine ligase n=1 Tax=Membranihabitans maritimus TaxID=2904244 RepID=UPI001F00C46F|nr:pantoate--beta-alanine ligase [Membranihabitans maritimus]